MCRLRTCLVVVGRALAPLQIPPATVLQAQEELLAYTQLGDDFQAVVQEYGDIMVCRMTLVFAFALFMSLDTSCVECSTSRHEMRPVLGLLKQLCCSCLVQAKIQEVDRLFDKFTELENEAAYY